MKKEFFALILIAIVFMNACGIQPLPTPNAYSQTPSSHIPFIDVGDTLATSTPLPGDPFLASPTIEIFDTPTFSPTLTPIPNLRPSQAIPFVNIYMMDESSGWGIEENGHIVHTNDGAISWSNVTPPQGAYDSGGFFALDGQTAWATPYCLGYLFGGDNLYFCPDTINQTNVWVTRDGGNTWLASSPICLNSGCKDPISSGGDGSLLPESIRFIDPERGWLAISTGSSMNQNRYNIFYTNDGGKRWNFLISDFTNDIIGGDITAVEVLNEKNIFLFTNQALGPAQPSHDLEYSFSKDGGHNWKDEYSDFAFQSITIKQGISLASEDRRCGTIESKAIPPLVLDLTQVCYYDSKNTSYFIHLHSENGGKTWNYWQQTGEVNFINPKTGWQLAAKDDTHYELQQTQDGGLTWVKVKTVEWDGVLNFVNEHSGYALAYNHGIMAVMQTVDGGKTWKMNAQGTLSRIPCLLSTWDICDR